MLQQSMNIEYLWIYLTYKSKIIHAFLFFRSVAWFAPQITDIHIYVIQRQGFIM